jgi:peptidyl-prolyl cis-trans isomerase A (cyclophilin A)
MLPFTLLAATFLLGLTTAVKAPASFVVEFKTDVPGTITMNIDRKSSPQGVDRFYSLLQDNFFQQSAFFRVVPGFIVQFGIAGIPSKNRKWKQVIPDDPVFKSNVRGTISFAKESKPNTRTTQIFINLKDNSYLDNQGFSPFGTVTKGMDIVAKIFNPTPGKKDGVGQSEYTNRGNFWLKQMYPETNFITKTTILGDNNGGATTTAAAAAAAASATGNSHSDKFCTTPHCATCLSHPTVYGKRECFAHWLRNTVQNDATQFLSAECAAIQLQEQKILGLGLVVKDCHWIMHGAVEGRLFNKTKALGYFPVKHKLTMQELFVETMQSFSVCKPACDWACYHVIMAAYVRELVQRNVTAVTSNFVGRIEALSAAVVAQPKWLGTQSILESHQTLCIRKFIMV